ncbi:MAG: hypothetical protein CL527_05820 [Aequorivita sp.]|nr:hypothetical protein [Aequorivita sp.]MAO48219.1 hypothetical protein [Aequorivita sp.]|tara:strand:+ start:73449 stop:73634 length:186 start_codon:yes stop_codon:yes gene_type:complete
MFIVVFIIKNFKLSVFNALRIATIKIFRCNHIIFNLKAKICVKDINFIVKGGHNPALLFLF